MMEADLDDTHLCIKCSSTIVGLANYIQHRKRNCSSSSSTNPEHKITNNSQSNESHHVISTTLISTNANHTSLEHTYDSFVFHEPEPPSSYASKSEHGGKTSKSLSDTYDLPYELGADVFFSSLQLQSVQSTGPAQSTSGKTGSMQQQAQLQRQKSQQEHSEEHVEVTWIETHATSGQIKNTETLMKAVSDMSEPKKPYDSVFTPMTFVHESPDASEDEEEEEEEVEAEDVEDEDEDFDPIAAAGHDTSGGKWKLPPMRLSHSPPVVPATHTGGKWKPENRPNLRVTHTQLTRLSPNWDMDPGPDEVAEAASGQHPPAEHTKGKWIPGTKLQRLEYKAEVELAKSANQDYWCNICCRKLKNKFIYEHHLKTSYHLKRAEPEQQLEKAELDELQHGDIIASFALTEKNKSPKDETPAEVGLVKKRKRRAKFLKCDLCKHTMSRHLIGKHLISHYHYRRMQKHPGQSLRMILEHIHSVVLQSPYQCRPCRFYANTEETFMCHWNSPEHLDASERGPGKFWCSYCHFECEDNNQMRRHLLCADHKEVILAINRSVPICISKKLNIECGVCGQSFRYNAELRQHMQLCHPDANNTAGTSSDIYQSRFKCNQCAESCSSKIALQRHEKNKHSILKYFCSICKLEFNTPCKARQHRKTLEHRLQAATAQKTFSFRKQKTLSEESGKSTRECAKCDFVATSEVEAMMHELSHPNAQFSGSTDLLKASSSKASARKLPRTETKHAFPIKCKDCADVFESLNELRTHRDSMHPLLSHICMSCGQSFALAQSLGRHTRTCQPKSAKPAIVELTDSAQSKDDTEKLWICEDCSFRAPYESELIYHRLFHTYGTLTKQQLVKCPLCPNTYNKYSLRCHLRQHTNEKIFECRFCNLKFSRRHNLKDHISRTHLLTDEQPSTTAVAVRKDINKSTSAQKSDFQCDTCGKVFSKKYALKVHSAKHGSAVRRFHCSTEGCRYSATTESLLKVHLASHSQETFKCDHPNCSYIGKSTLHLRRHSRSHVAPSRLYSCDKCDFKARIKGHIVRHLRTHTAEKPFQCRHCDFRCSTFSNLRKHVLKTSKHPGKFIYECEMCRPLQETEGATVFKTNVFLEFQEHQASVH